MTFFKSWKRLPKKKKICILLLWAVIVFGTVYILGASLATPTFSTWKISRILRLYRKHPTIQKIAIGLGVFETIFVFYSLTMRSALNPILNEDDRGLEWSEKGTKGSSREMTEEEIKTTYTVGTIQPNTEFIYGKLDKGKGTRSVVSWRKSKTGDGNKITSVIGASGTGKSWCIINNNIMQAATRGDSIIVTDPKGEMWNKFHKYLEKLGYETKLFNLVESDYSAAWNCAKECINPRTGNFDPERANDFASTFMINTNLVPGKIGDEFWFNGALALLKALLAYCAEKEEESFKAKIKNYTHAAFKGQGIDDRVIDAALYENATINQYREHFSVALDKIGVSQEKIQEYLLKIEKDTEPKFTISAVYENLVKYTGVNELKQIFEGMPNKDASNYAYRMYKTFDNDDVKENVKASIIQGLMLRLSFLADEKVSLMLSEDEIDLSQPGKKKCAYFCLMSDRSLAKRVVSSLFFTFLFKDLMDSYDALPEDDKSNAKEVFLLMDEFFSIGAIPNITTYFSTCRSRKLAPVFVIQNYNQLIELYDEIVAQDIFSSPDTIIYLGCAAGDYETPKRLADLIGSGTIRVHRMTKNAVIGSYSDIAFDVDKVSQSDEKREVFSVDELRRLAADELILVKRSMNPARIQRIGYQEHPEFRKLENGSVYDYERLTLRYEKARDHDSKKMLEMLHNTDSSLFSTEKFEEKVYAAQVKVKEGKSQAEFYGNDEKEEDEQSKPPSSENNEPHNGESKSKKPSSKGTKKAKTEQSSKKSDKALD